MERITNTTGAGGWRAVLALVLALAVLTGCNLGFDASQYPPLPPEEVDAGDDTGGNNASNNGGDAGENNALPRGCEDNDGDQFGRGLACKKDQIDCDDTKAFVYPGAPEMCDSTDNDCDERTDEGPDRNPLRQSCYTGDPSELGHANTSCRSGFLTCTNGQFPEETMDTCVSQVLPRAFGESEGAARCDGMDNDCDGTVDPECVCPEEGFERPCYESGPPSASGVGICARGLQRCLRGTGGDLEWGDCQGDVPPGTETCGNSGADNDCNGVVDDVAEQGDACETSELGRCRMGESSCSNGVLVCNRALEPIDETCNGVDDDCDGAVDDGVSNVCGGCGALPGEPGGVCGACNDGEWACAPSLELTCVGARPLNGCNGCGELEGSPGTGCGACGVWRCSGTDAVACEEGNTNSCGGCGPIPNESRLGTACGQCGRWACDGDQALRCDDAGFNACGGCAVLTASPGDTCGPCNDGRYACSADGESLVCQGATPLNACGGCNVLTSQPGQSCGAQCGRFECDPNNPGRLRCNDPGFNACEGCGEILNEPGTPCGRCGSYECDEDTGNTACMDGGRNSCGGCATLPGVVGANCGQCGQWRCVDEETMDCNDPGLNACNGCGDLAGQRPGDPCGQCGSLVCSLDRTRLLCDDEPFNACGGCGTVTGPALGAACGVCGTNICDGTNSTRCNDPGLNSCLTCGALTTAPGANCNGCGYFTCGANDTFCDMRECPGPLTAARLINLVLHTRSCTTNADCGPMERCVSADNQGGVNDTCAPDFHVEFDRAVDLPYTPFTWQNLTAYLASPILGGNHNIEAWSRDQNPNSDVPKITLPYTLPFNQEMTVVFSTQREACTMDSMCSRYEAGNPTRTTCQTGVCSTTCAVTADCPGGSCVNGRCAFYQARQFLDQNQPVRDRAKLRFMNFHPNFAALRLRNKPPTGPTTVLFNAVDYANASSYLEVAPGDYHFELTTTAGIPIAQFTPRAVKGGEVVTVIFYGRQDGTVYWIFWPNDRDPAQVVQLF